MAEHLRKSQAELTELLTEYWRLRHETGECGVVRRYVALMSFRGLYGDSRQQARHASQEYMTVFVAGQAVFVMSTSLLFVVFYVSLVASSSSSCCIVISNPY